MDTDKKRKLEKILLLAIKIAVGSAAAVYVAEALHLENAVSAGTVTLLSLLGTKRETVRVSVARIGAFLLTVLLAYLAIPNIESDWITYCVILFILVFVLAVVGWMPTLSVNFVIIAHYVTKKDFSREFFFNEFLLVLIGAVIACILNLFHFNRKRKVDIMADMRYTEEKLQYILRELAGYLREEQMSSEISVWDDICMLEKKLKVFMEEAREFQNNNFADHHSYYLDYFEMRLEQCRVLDNLHYEMKKIRTVPKEAEVIADYMCYLVNYVTEKNIPKEQNARLQEIFAAMKKENLPENREEFENQAMLYHIMMDIEEFLKYKMEFIENLDERQRKAYWD